jgi:hypothetical protein
MILAGVARVPSPARARAWGNMRDLAILVTAAAIAIGAGTACLADVKEVAYPAIKVRLSDAYHPDAAFQKMQKSFADAVAKKDAQALFSLVGPTFVWTSGGELDDQFDFSGDALQNFKVVFGFREFGKRVDGGVMDGPFWDTLAAFAATTTFDNSAQTLVCGPIGADIADSNAFENAKRTIGAGDSVDWYFTIADTSATATPTGGGSIGRANQIAVPVLDVYPPVTAGQPGPPTTHLKVLLPSGKSGWIPISAAVPLNADRLCYAHLPSGEWKIALFDQAE